MGVTHASEEFRDYLSWADLAENALRYWIGDAPRLTDADGDERYGRVEPDSGAITTVTVTLASFALTSQTSMSMQVRTLGATADTFELFFANSTGSNYVYLDVSAGTSWQTVSGRVADFSGWAVEQSGLVAAAAAGELVAGVLGPLGVATGYGVSWIDVGLLNIPTRVYPRADGLGMGAPRLMDGRSPYRSSRVFGMI